MGDYYYDYPGNCETCPIYGCPDRHHDNIDWYEVDRDTNNTKRVQDELCPRNTDQDDIRRAKIFDCKTKRDSGEDVPSSKQMRTRKVLVNEYTVTVEFYYDVMPSSKHIRKECVFAEDPDRAEKQALKKYPNCRVLNTIHVD